MTASGGSDPSGLERRLDALVPELLTAAGTPGAIVAVARDGRTLARGAWGAAQTHDEHGPLTAVRPMTPDTRVDIASITKVVATTTVAMRLVALGALDLHRPIATWLPDLPPPLARASARDLLEHRSGLPEWAPLFHDAPGRDPALAEIGRLGARARPQGRVYSDLGMMLLGGLLEQVGDASLDELVDALVLQPLGLASTGYRPARGAGPLAATSTGNPVEAGMLAEHRPELADRDLTTQPWWRPRVLVGEVNDANAAIAFDGVAGHAGLFSTADDLLRYGTQLLRALHGASTGPLEPSVVRRFAAPGREAGQGLGLWRRRIADTLGRPGADDSVGHRGFTGCELLVSPAERLVVVLLSNRLHGPHPPPDHAAVWRPVLRAVVSHAGEGS